MTGHSGRTALVTGRGESMSRRRFAQLALASAAALPFLHPSLAAAAPEQQPLSEETPSLQYVLKLVDDPELDSVYAHLEPNANSDVIASVPYGTPVTILSEVEGEKLWYGGRTWYEVALPYGTGWLYHPLLGDEPTVAAAEPLPPPVPAPAFTPDPVGKGRSIVISLAHQFLWAFEDADLKMAVACSTGGVGLETPTGDFQVKKHIRNYMFNSPWAAGSPYWYASEEASYAILFHGTGYFMHDAPWRRIFGPQSQGGEGKLGKDRTGSHGCVNLPYFSARFLYTWAPNGAPVRVI